MFLVLAEMRGFGGGTTGSGSSEELQEHLNQLADKRPRRSGYFIWMAAGRVN